MGPAIMALHAMYRVRIYTLFTANHRRMEGPRQQSGFFLLCRSQNIQVLTIESLLVFTAKFLAQEDLAVSNLAMSSRLR